jgi:N-acetylglutamate synthase-like GNAT family acetyltransferase
MNTELIHRPSSRRQTAHRIAPPRRPAVVAFRRATAADAESLHALIDGHVQEGRLLPRQLDELRTRAARFVVATRRGRLVGCAELAPLSARVAEVRSLVVARSARNAGIGRTLVRELQTRARTDGFQVLCAFTHDAGYFVRLGYSIVPHAWLPEKIAMDCQRCPLFRTCGQSAVQLALVAQQHGEDTRKANHSQLAEVVA